LHGADEHPHPLVEREGVHLARAVLQPLEVRGQRLLDRRPVEVTEDGGRLVEIQALGWRIGLGAGQPGHRVLGLDVARREPFGRHGVRDLPRRDLRTHDGAGEHGDLVPALAHAARAGEPNLHARLVVERVVALGGAPALARDDGLERAHRAAAGRLDPGRRRLRRRHADQQPHLRPGELAACEGRRDVGQLGQPRVHVRERLELTGGEAEALARVVADPGKAERVLALLPEEGAGHGAEDAAAARLLAREAAEVAVEKERALVTHEVTPLVTGRRLEMLGRDEIEASEGRGRERHSNGGGREANIRRN